jgi:hypothetical protein
MAAELGGFAPPFYAAVVPRLSTTPSEPHANLQPSKWCFLRTPPLGSKLSQRMNPPKPAPSPGKGSTEKAPRSNRFHHVPQAYKGRPLLRPSSNILHTYLARRSSDFVLQRQLLSFLSFSNSVITPAAFTSTLSAICHAQRHPSQTPPSTNTTISQPPLFTPMLFLVSTSRPAVPRSRLTFR